jgi:hypothetical protein
MQAKLPASLWPYTLINSTYIRNRVSSTACLLDDSHIPYTAWYGHLPDTHHVGVFGARTYVNIQRKAKKTGQQSWIGMIVDMMNFIRTALAFHPAKVSLYVMILLWIKLSSGYMQRGICLLLCMAPMRLLTWSGPFWLMQLFPKCSQRLIQRFSKLLMLLKGPHPKLFHQMTC